MLSAATAITAAQAAVAAGAAAPAGDRATRRAGERLEVQLQLRNPELGQHDGWVVLGQEGTGISLVELQEQVLLGGI